MTLAVSYEATKSNLRRLLSASREQHASGRLDAFRTTLEVIETCLQQLGATSRARRLARQRAGDVEARSLAAEYAALRARLH